VKNANCFLIVTILIWIILVISTATVTRKDEYLDLSRQDLLLATFKMKSNADDNYISKVLEMWEDIKSVFPVSS